MPSPEHLFALILVGAVAFASVLNTLASSLYLPAIDAVQSDLGASDEAISLSVSLFIFVQSAISGRADLRETQGISTLAWASLAELGGRRACYLVASATLVRS